MALAPRKPENEKDQERYEQDLKSMKAEPAKWGIHGWFEDRNELLKERQKIVSNTKKADKIIRTSKK